MCINQSMNSFAGGTAEVGVSSGKKSIQSDATPQLAGKVPFTCSEHRNADADTAQGCLQLWGGEDS